jgi:hypothetical protein
LRCLEGAIRSSACGPKWIKIQWRMLEWNLKQRTLRDVRSEVEAEFVQRKLVSYGTRASSLWEHCPVVERLAKHDVAVHCLGFLFHHRRARFMQDAPRTVPAACAMMQLNGTISTASLASPTTQIRFWKHSRRPRTARQETPCDASPAGRPHLSVLPADSRRGLRLCYRPEGQGSPVASFLNQMTMVGTIRVVVCSLGQHIQSVACEPAKEEQNLNLRSARTADNELPGVDLDCLALNASTTTYLHHPLANPGCCRSRREVCLFIVEDPMISATPTGSKARGPLVQCGMVTLQQRRVNSPFFLG